MQFEEVKFIYIYFAAYIFGLTFNKLLTNQKSWFPSMLSSNLSIVLVMIFRSLIHFLVNFSTWGKARVQFHTSVCADLVFPVFFVEKTNSAFSIERFWNPCPESFGQTCRVYFWAPIPWTICVSLCQYHIVLKWFYNKFGNQEVWFLQLCSSFPRLFWLF